MRDLVRLALEHSKDAVLVFTNHLASENPNPQIIYANSKFLELSSANIDDVLKTSPCRFIGENTNKELVKKIIATVSNQKPWQSPLTVYTRDKQEIQVYIKIAPVQDYKKNIQYYVCFIQDMTSDIEIKEMDDIDEHLAGFINSVCCQNEYMADIFENVPNGLWRMNLNGDILFANDICKADFSLTQGKNFFELIHSGERKHIKAMFDECKPNNKLNTVMFRIREAEKLAWVECVYWPITKNSTVIGFSGTIKDVTKNKLLVKQLETLKGKNND